MAGGTSNGAGRRTPSRAEIDALGEVIAEALAMAELAKSEAAAALLRRALELLQDRDEPPKDGGGPGATEFFNPS